MPLLNDMARCMGYLNLNGEEYQCERRDACVRYLERRQGGPLTQRFAYICLSDNDEFIHAEKQNDA